MKASWLRRVQFALVTAVSYITFSQLWSVSFFYVYQTRDLNRALGILQGQAIFFGPETNGGGHLPGSLYYYLLSLPYLVGLDWMAAWHIMVILASLGVALCWRACRDWFGHFAASLAALSFLASPIIWLVLSQFNNASFAILFIVLSLWFLLRSVKTGEAKFSQKDWIFCCLVAGLGVQMHYSVILCVLILPVYKLFSGKAAVVSWRQVIGGLAVFVLPLLPFVVWLTMQSLGWRIGQQPFDFTGSEGPVKDLIQTLVVFISRLGALDARVYVHRVFWLGNPVFLAFVAPFLLTLWLVCRKCEVEPLSESRQNSLPVKRILAISMILAVAPSLYFLQLYFRARYAQVLVIPSFFAVGLSVAWAERRFGRFFEIYVKGPVVYLFLSIMAVALLTFGVADELRGRLGLAVLLWLVFAACLYFGEKKLSFRNVCAYLLLFTFPMLLLHAVKDKLYNGYAIPYIEDTLALSKYIHENTGWDYNEARKRLFLLDFFNQTDLEYQYKSVAATGVRPPAEVPSGYIVQLLRSFRAEQLFENRNSENFHAELAESGQKQMRLKGMALQLKMKGVEESIVKNIEAGHIKIGKPLRITSRLVVHPYSVVYGKTPLPYFSNVGLGYEHSPQLEVFAGGQVGDTAVWRSESGEIIFRWNECPGHHRYCSVGYKIAVMEKRPSEVVLKVELLGVPISVPSINLVPQWTLAISRPEVHVTCGTETHSLRLAEAVGFSFEDVIMQSQRTAKALKKGTGVGIRKNSLKAPLETVWRAPCQGELQRIQAGWQSSTALMSLDMIQLGESRLTFDFSGEPVRN